MKPTRLLPAALFALSCCFASTSGSAAEEPAKSTDPVIFLLDTEALFGYSDIAGPSQSDFSTSEKWLTSAALKLNEKDQLIALYNGSFQRDHIFIRQDEGSQSSNQIMSHNFSGALKKYFGEEMVFKPLVFYNMVYVKETADEALGDGLYDYADWGGGFENTHVLPTADDKVRKLTYGFNAFLREYPNYRTLEALSSREPIEDKEKDFVGYKTDAGYRAPWWFGTAGRVSGSVLVKDYSDKRAIDTNGIRQNGHRNDLYLETTAAVSKAFTEVIGVSFASGLKDNLSNLDFYDTRNTLSLSDDRFFENYFDYWSYNLAPTVTITGPAFAAEAPPSSLQAGYAFEKTYYPGRVAQDVSGVLLNRDQEDRNAKTSVQVQVPFNSSWSWLLSGSYEKQVSNQKFENSFLYSYESWSILSGFRFEL